MLTFTSWEGLETVAREPAWSPSMKGLGERIRKLHRHARVYRDANQTL